RDGGRGAGGGRERGAGRYAQPGQGGGQLRAAAEPSVGLKRRAEALLSRQGEDHRAACRARVQVLADLVTGLAWCGGDAGHRVGDGVLRPEGGRRWRRPQPGWLVKYGATA